MWETVERDERDNTVIACLGHFLFPEQECPHVVVLGTLLACCAFLNIIAFLILIRRRQKPVCEHCKGRLIKCMLHDLEQHLKPLFNIVQAPIASKSKYGIQKTSEDVLSYQAPGQARPGHLQRTF